MADSDLFSSIEQEINSEIPVTLKNFLIINGYDSQAALMNMSASSICAIEKFAQTELPEIIPAEELN